MLFRRSFAMGTVRLLEGGGWGDPATEVERGEVWRRVVEWMRVEVLPVLREAVRVGGGDGGSLVLVGTGGTTTLLGRMELGLETYDRELLEGVSLGVAEVTAWRDRVWGMSVEERRGIRGLPANRADVIAPGVAIVQAIMAGVAGEWGGRPLRVSLRGLRFGVLLSLVEEDGKGR